jgi:hypothetical protein
LHDGIAKVKGYLLNVLQKDYLKALVPVLNIMFHASTSACKTDVPTACWYLTFLEKTLHDLNALVVAN